MRKSKESPESPSKVILVGGLGNQLFGFLAGQYLNKVIGMPVEYLQAGSPLYFSGLRSSMYDLKTPGTELISYKPLSLIGSKISRRLGGATPSSMGRQGFKLLPKTFISSGIGFDEELEHVEPGSYVHGYFQTYKYLRHLEEAGGVFTCELKAESPWYREMKRRMESADPIVMHIRRGDYRNLSTSIGLLAERYYMEALETLGPVESTRPIWIFSDEALPINEQFLRTTGRDFVWVNQKGAQSAAEVLFLMSQSRYSIISNSTFSWWSAVLGVNKTVVAPSKWFKLKEDPRDLIPGNWLMAKSFWE